MTGECRLRAILIYTLVILSQVDSLSQLLAKESNDVSLRTYKVLKDSSKGSFVASPFGLRIMMAMLMPGARGNTRFEIQGMMRFPSNDEDLFEPYREYIQQLNTPASVKTEVANRLFLKEGFLIQENFLNVLKHYFQAPPQQMSFDKPKKAAEEINNFVSRKTNHRIQRVVDSSDLTNQTRMVLVNTLYFKGPWKNPFPTSSTRRMPFHIDDSGRSSTVDMMRVEAFMQAKDFKELDCKAVIIPYQEEGFQMVVLVPNRRSGLSRIEDNLRDFTSLDSLYNVKARNIELRLPRFRIESGFDLKETLKEMGIRDVFDSGKSDLSGIPSVPRNKQGKQEDNKLFVSKVIQKSYLAVDEAGSEAGAATLSVVFFPLSVGPPVEEVITVDRPFFGFIRDSKTNTILFTFRKVD